ncbi:DUF2877 domain-containing protein [Nocardioides carbamazepini]|uniref:DUF2877 domain-containing protein n=1 Tax=Nocardioides carbamazepini TaxID=2854259 RepID=UPI00214A2B13|nr:DUF2877 domain-containing protein [Nocardioides carbamazepini]MCR1785692.1 DUF2877 domain-containing protein [Nocardioides carbamazepini]
MTATAGEHAGRPVDAVSVDARLAAALPIDGRTGTVHSVHARVVNLRTPDGLLCCLASDELDDAPRTVLIAAADWGRIGWHRDDPVRFGPALTHAYDGTTVVLAGATPWQPSPADTSALTPDLLRHAAATVERHLLTPAHRTPFEVASADELGRRTTALADAIRGDAATAVTAAAARLVGLGAGLTPSGDDLLTGLAVLAAADGMALGRIRPALAEAVLGHAPLEERTTAVSAATLTEAVAGRARQRIHDLVTALVSTGEAGTAGGVGSGGRSSLVDAVLRVRAIGHTSGADILTGLRLGLTLEADLREANRLAAPTHPKENS